MNVGLDVLRELYYQILVSLLSLEKSFGIEIPVSPASPEKAIRVCLLSCFVLSSEALRMVAPLIAAFEAATTV